MYFSTHSSVYLDLSRSIYISIPGQPLQPSSLRWTSLLKNNDNKNNTNNTAGVMEGRMAIRSNIGKRMTIDTSHPKKRNHIIIHGNLRGESRKKKKKKKQWLIFALARPIVQQDFQHR